MSAEMSDQKPEPATLQVAGESPASCKVDIEERAREIDIAERDPNGMNGHIMVRFNDLIAEPDTEVFSFDNIWTLSYTVFTLSKIWCYRITSLLLAVPLAAIWGVYFACLSFCTVWCCKPCLRCCAIKFDCFRQYYEMIIACSVTPFFVAFGKCFNTVKLNVVHEKI